jgi:hypothetical protein
MFTPAAEVYEKLASFYLGRHFDLESGKLLDDLLMVDARDFCTHALCVGMTGSGKTGLCISLLEEAALDGVPVVCIDPKGDLANLLLTFPELRPEDFAKYIDKEDAKRKEISPEELAEETAQRWRDGLASWGQSPDRIKKLKDSVEMAIYTPGSTLGIPLTVLKSFDAPSEEQRRDAAAIADRITASISGLLALMGIESDPMTSTEHILLASILHHHWGQGKSLTLEQMVQLIQKPPINRVGVVDLESFMSATDRSKLALRLNNILASPAFASWREGEPLSIKQLLYTEQTGRPRLSIISIAHLSDPERMFFVTILLNELLAWVRTQSGTSSLRAMFYMDEIAGYFPPVSNPPSKPPMMTLLKQARAFGLGIVLATQNPLDLDYKGLSNIGTWFLGRLQTERDKARVLDGLLGAAGESGQKLDRSTLDRILSGLKSRVFLMNNVHQGAPCVFQSRWAMSYLAGPLSRTQIQELMDAKRGTSQRVAEDREDQTTEAPDFPSPPSTTSGPHPAIPAGVEERFAVAMHPPSPGAALVYRPAMYAEGEVHFVVKAAGVDLWSEVRHLMHCHDRVLPDDAWESSIALADKVAWELKPDEDYSFADVPDVLLNKATYRSLQSRFKDFLYRQATLTTYHSPLLREHVMAENEADARVQLAHRLRECRDQAMEKLRDKYWKKVEPLERRIRSADERVDRERSQSRTSMVAAGSSVVGALLGGLLGGRRTSMSTAARGLGHATQQGDDVRRAEAAREELERDKRRLEDDLERDLEKLHAEYDLERLEIQPVKHPPRKGDLKASMPLLLWMPWQIDADGREEALQLWE